jgi:hypothetical protein
MRHRVMAVSFSAVCILAAATLAATILDQSQPDKVNISPGGYPTTTHWMAQNLTPTDQTSTRLYLDSVELQLATGTKPINVIVEIYGQKNDNGLSLTTLLGSSTLKDIHDAKRNWYAFKFDDLQIGSYTSGAGTGRLLMVVKSDSDPEKGEVRRIYGGSGNPYSGGQWRYTLNSGRNWATVGGKAVEEKGGSDMAFKLHITPEF